VSENWRVETDAEDYFGHQKKKLTIADRRPVIRRADQLLGPGIASTAIRITDFNNLLAQFNGFFSAAGDAANGPAADQNYVGTVISDAEFGGVQAFYGMEDGELYRRIFTRNPGDPDSISWGVWAVV
jgi:hypothetical protein